VFYPGHPLLTSAQQVPASALLQTRAAAGLEKISFWVQQHAAAADFLYFHSFMQPARTPTVASLRDSALKSQIITGLELIGYQEAAVAAASPSPFSKNGFPFPVIADLREVHSIWRDVCRNDFFCHELNLMIDQFVRETIAHLKSIATSIVSLLASQDGVPENYVPVVKYQRLDLSPEMAANHDIRCRILRSKIEQLELANAQIYKRMAHIETMFGEIGSEHQTAIKAMLREFRADYNEVGGFMKATADTTPFWDFLNHPNCLARARAHIFLTDRSSDHLMRLIRELIGLYELDTDIDVLIALCSSSLVLEYSPVITDFGTPGEISLDAFDLFVEHDPLRWLGKVVELCRGKEFRQEFPAIVVRLNVFTDSTRELLRYVVDYTIADFLSQEMRSARADIIDFLKGCE
jgi:hypothetical protein